MALQLPDSSSSDEIFLSHDELFSESDPTESRSAWIWVLLGVLAGIGFFYLGVWSQSRSVKPNLIGPFESGGTSSPPPVVVHVAGQVHKPGVYELAFDARVRQAIHQAGGPKPDADLDAINLAAYLEDGQKLEVPAKPAPLESTSQDEPQVLSLELPDTEEISEAETSRSLAPLLPPSPESAQKTRPLPQPASTKKPAETVAPEIPRAKTGSGQESQNADPEYLKKNPLRINTATQQELELLPGIGPMLAGRIIAYREEKGKFETAEELGEVPGIGEKRLEQLLPLVTVE